MKMRPEEEIIIVLKVIKAIASVLIIELENKIERMDRDDKDRLEDNRDYPPEDYPYPA